MDVKNCKYLAPEMGDAVECEIDHPTLGWIPFTASKDDVEEFGRTLYTEIINGEHGDIVEYITPPVVKTKPPVDGSTSTDTVATDTTVTK